MEYSVPHVWGRPLVYRHQVTAMGYGMSLESWRRPGQRLCIASLLQHWSHKLPLCSPSLPHSVHTYLGTGSASCKLTLAQLPPPFQSAQQSHATSFNP